MGANLKALAFLGAVAAIVWLAITLRQHNNAEETRFSELCTAILDAKVAFILGPGEGADRVSKLDAARQAPDPDHLAPALALCR